MNPPYEMIAAGSPAVDDTPEMLDGELLMLLDLSVLLGLVDEPAELELAVVGVVMLGPLIRVLALLRNALASCCALVVSRTTSFTSPIRLSRLS